MILQRLWVDPQEGEGHYCARCLREIFGNDEVCEKCRLREEYEMED